MSFRTWRGIVLQSLRLKNRTSSVVSSTYVALLLETELFNDVMIHIAPLSFGSCHPRTFSSFLSYSLINTQKILPAVAYVWPFTITSWRWKRLPGRKKATTHSRVPAITDPLWIPFGFSLGNSFNTRKILRDFPRDSFVLQPANTNVCIIVSSLVTCSTKCTIRRTCTISARYESY